MGYTDDQSMANFSVSNATPTLLAVMASTSQSNYTSGALFRGSSRVPNSSWMSTTPIGPPEVMTNASMAEGNASWTAYTNMSGEQGTCPALPTACTA